MYITKFYNFLNFVKIFRNEKYRNYVKIFEFLNFLLYFIFDRFRLFNRCFVLAINRVVSANTQLCVNDNTLYPYESFEQICDFAFQICKSKLLIRNTNLERQITFIYYQNNIFS